MMVYKHDPAAIREADLYFMSPEGQKAAASAIAVGWLTAEDLEARLAIARQRLGLEG
jgi:hypothetical protein